MSLNRACSITCKTAVPLLGLCSRAALSCDAFQAKRDPTQRSLETRLRNARYLAELTKFRLVPFGTIFSLLKSLLDDFVGHNVDAAAALVDTAGRFLYRLPETQTRMNNMLEVAACSRHIA